jgi:hypothetical protein
LAQVEFGEDNLRAGRVCSTHRRFGHAYARRPNDITSNAHDGAYTITPALLLVACQRETDTTVPAAHPVRTTTVEKRETGERLTFTGRLEAEDEVIEAAFRNCGTGNPRLQPGNHPIS